MKILPFARRPSILIVTRHTPLPWEDGAGAYLHDLARFLARDGFRVDVLWLAPHDDLRWRKVWRLPPAFDSSVRLRLPGAVRFGRFSVFAGMLWLPFRARALHRARQLLAMVGLRVPRRTAATPPAPAAAPRPWMSPPSAGERAVVERFALKLRPDIVVASYAWMCPIFDLPALQSARHACLAHDVAWQRSRLAAADAGASESPAVSRDDEVAWLKSTATIIAITAADAVELRALAPAAEVFVAPKACEIDALPPATRAPSGQRLLFVGSGNSFNVEGLEWFLRHVWPQVRAAVPGARLDICGWIDRAVSMRPDGVTFHGSVPDLAPLYRDASVVIVPLLRTSGLNIKLVDAAAAARAIVTTSGTLVGAPFLRGTVQVADSPADFAAAVGLLLTDVRLNRASAVLALAAVRTHLSPAACYGGLGAHLRSAA